MAQLLLIVFLALVVWFLFVMPARRRRTQHAAMQDSVGLGDEIITAGGLHGIVREMVDDRLRIEVAEGVVVTLDRRAVAAVAREIEVEVEPEDETEHEAEDEEPSGAGQRD